MRVSPYRLFHANSVPGNAAACAYPLSIRPVPYPTLSEDEVIVIVAATAGLFAWFQYYITLGNDAADTVVEVGAGVTKFKVGDRVVGLNMASNSRSGAYQNCCALEAKITYTVPDDLGFSDAAVLPLGPGTPPPAPGSDVGSNEIQLAVAAGYEVITTASPKDFEYCKKLGASQVFDCSSDTITQGLLKEFEGKTSKSDGAKFVATAFGVPEKLPEKIKTKMVWGHQCAPHAFVVGHGLDRVQEQETWDKIEEGRCLCH
ncbi:GroES-like protein [Xylaria acuta]|nr:GroES-like protein [Xylaria acuta]